MANDLAKTDVRGIVESEEGQLAGLLWVQRQSGWGRLPETSQGMTSIKHRSIKPREQTASTMMVRGKAKA